MPARDADGESVLGHVSESQHVNLQPEAGSATICPDTSSSLRFYEDLANKYGPNDMRRYGWAGQYLCGTFLPDLYNELAQLIPQGATRVLDVGCGGGEFAEVLRQRRPELRYLGIDISSQGIEVARDRLASSEQYQFICCDFWEFLLGPESKTDMDGEAQLLERHAHQADISSPTQWSSAKQTWDFVISVGCVFSHCSMTHTGLAEQLRLLDVIMKSSERGLLLICHGSTFGHGIDLAAAEKYIAGSVVTSQAYRGDDQAYRESINQVKMLEEDDASDDDQALVKPWETVPWYYVSPEDGRARKPFLKKIQYQHRLVILFR